MVHNPCSEYANIPEEVYKMCIRDRNLDFHTVVLQYLFNILQETAATHRMTTGSYKCTLTSFELSQILNRTMTHVAVSYTHLEYPVRWQFP